MDNKIQEILQDNFFVRLQRELEDNQNQLETILNPNQYLVILTKIDLLKTILDSYINYLEEKQNGSK